MTWHEILNIILFNIKSILKITVLSTLFIFLILLFVYPRTFKSTVSILPPEKNSQLSGLGSLIGGGDFNGLMSGGISSASAQLYGEILKSRSASQYVVRKLNLIKFYNADDEIEAAEKLSKKLNVDISKEGIIELSVDVQSTFVPLIFDDSKSLKILAAKISNSYVEALDNINREKISSKAKNARIYIESQLLLTKQKLDSVEVSLMEFQKKNKAVSLPDQVEAVIKSTAQLKTEILKAEIELNLLKSNFSEESKSYISLQRKLSALREQYSNFEIGNEDYMLAFKDIPELGREFANLLREVKIQNEVYLLLQQQYYKEKIQENRDVSIVQVLDTATPPKKASTPKTILSTLFGSLLIFLIACLYIVTFNKKIKTK
ncbi:MAG: hypothetical protein IPJ23_03140 [Ignavibacteriales bacterium]|nr:hypothetical protein [Ignavibacteriales bacterium]